MHHASQHPSLSIKGCQHPISDKNVIAPLEPVVLVLEAIEATLEVVSFVVEVVEEAMDAISVGTHEDFGG